MTPCWYKMVTQEAPEHLSFMDTPNLHVFIKQRLLKKSPHPQHRGTSTSRARTEGPWTGLSTWGPEQKCHSLKDQLEYKRSSATTPSHAGDLLQLSVRGRWTPLLANHPLPNLDSADKSRVCTPQLAYCLSEPQAPIPHQLQPSAKAATWSTH